MSGCFVTGTDTEVGKTVVCAALLRLLGSLGVRCAAMKPVASGAEPTAQGLRNADACTLMEAAGVDAAYEDVNPWVFADAVAPHLAARDVGVEIEVDRILDAFARTRARSEFVVVEGVGGWLVPLGPRLSVETLAQALRLPVVLVVGLRLGCINHALLTERAILGSGCRLAGWVANHLTPEFEKCEENIAALDEAMQTPRLGRVPWSEAGNDPVWCVADTDVLVSALR